jgi:hypothetical protein
MCIDEKKKSLTYQVWVWVRDFRYPTQPIDNPTSKDQI